MASRKEAELPPMVFEPTRIFFSRGVGVHSIQRVAIQRAMEDAGVNDLNLVKVTSVIPPKCEIITAQHGLRLLRPGSVCFAVIGQGETNEPHQRVTASLCWGQPVGDDLPGYITEVEEDLAKGKSEKTASDEAGQALVQIFAEKLGVKANAERVWGRRGQSRYIRVGNRRIRVGSVVSSAVGAEEQDGEKKYTVAVVVGVFL
jgi:arginine decarboxylase